MNLIYRRSLHSMLFASFLVIISCGKNSVDPASIVIKDKDISANNSGINTIGGVAGSPNASTGPVGSAGGAVNTSGGSTAGGSGNQGGSSTTPDNADDAGYYFKGAINGKTTSWMVTDVSDWAAGVAVNSLQDNGIIDAVIAGSISNVKNVMSIQPAIHFHFRNFHYPDYSLRSSIFASFVNTGLWPFAASKEPVEGAKDIFISYLDNGTGYSSIGNQTGSNINILSVTKIPSQTGISQKLKIHLRFSCQLYPENGNGSVLTITNGEAVIFLQDSL